MSHAWLSQTATDLGRGIAASEIDPIELCETFLSAIEDSTVAGRIYARTTEARARTEANAARQRQRAGNRLSLLDGVPISWKDLFDSAGTATEAGSALLKNRVPPRDAEVLRNAKAMGLVCLGKTHMSELAFSGLGYNPITATPPCVNDLEAVSGGSSSGAAGSVAFNLAAAGIGSDTGGSVRIPAAWNDLVGLKTTAGRVSLKGVVPLCEKIDTVGPLCRSVEDAAHIFAALEGKPPIDLGGAGGADLRLAVLETVAFDDLRDQPAQGFERAVSKLETAGAQIDRIRINAVTDVMPLAAVVFSSEAYGIWHNVIEAAPDKMFPEILERFRSGAAVSATDYVAAWRSIGQLQQAYMTATAAYDAVILPTSPILPPNLDRLASDHSYYVTENLLALRNTRIANLLGLCAMTLPTGISSAGIMLFDHPNAEERLLRTARAVEIALT
ncbi:MAG: amidase family protein [Pseudoruegeria sp.]